VIADQDPPLHEAFRAVVAPFFTPSFLRRFTDGFVDICHALVDTWSARSEVAFVREFAEPLPIRAITRIFDLPVIDEVEQETRFARWRDAATISVGSEVERNQLLEAEREICEMQRYFFSHISAANEKDSSLFAALKFGVVDLSDGSRRPLTDAERLTIMRQLFVGGVETTTKALSEAMLHLSVEPEMFSALASDADLCRRIVEESLRLSAPAQGILRTTTRARGSPNTFRSGAEFTHALAHHLRGLNFRLPCAYCRKESAISRRRRWRHLRTIPVLSFADLLSYL
jgi:cytochrome P450